MWSILREDTKKHFRIREEIRETSSLRTVVEEVRIRKGAGNRRTVACGD